MTDTISNSSRPVRGLSRLSLLLLILAMFVMAVVDVSLDDPRSVMDPHLLVELTLVALCGGGVVVLARGWLRESRSVEELGAVLEERALELEAWKERSRDVSEAFRRAIDTQLAAWRLTPTETEVARFLLEGYSHKEIAAATGRSERTVRQHATVVYRKSGLGGRAELSAFFLQGLMAGGEVEAVAS